MKNIEDDFLLKTTCKNHREAYLDKVWCQPQKLGSKMHQIDQRDLWSTIKEYLTLKARVIYVTSSRFMLYSATSL